MLRRDQVHAYYSNLKAEDVAARVAMRRLEHLYYKHDDMVKKAAKVGQLLIYVCTDRAFLVSSFLP